MLISGTPRQWLVMALEVESVKALTRMTAEERRESRLGFTSRDLIFLRFLRRGGGWYSYQTSRSSAFLGRAILALNVRERRPIWVKEDMVIHSGGKASRLSPGLVAGIITFEANWPVWEGLALA